MVKLKKTTLYVKGMHCASCEILISDKFKEEGNVREVCPHFASQKVEVKYVGHLDREKLNQKISSFGYQIVDDKKAMGSEEPLTKKLLDVSAIAIILFILYFFAQEFNLIPNFNLSGNLSLLTVFVLGLVASTSTCMATSGALFLATVGKLDSGRASLARMTPAFSFVVGRIISYGFFGLLAGFVGKVVVSDFKFGSGLTLLVSLFMILLGLDMVKIVSISSIIPGGLNKRIFESLEHRLIKNPKKTAFLLGAVTYFLPCGFTQTVQVYALGLANPIQSALTMTVFVLGTVPALLLIGGLNSFTKSSFYPYFMKVMGVLVFIIGIYYITNFLSIYGVNVNPFIFSNQALGENAAVKDGYQTVFMDVISSGYRPNTFTIKKDIPVKWIINGKNVFGCQGYLVAPALGIQKALTEGENIIEFTPDKVGTISFSCGMGMYRGRFNVVGG